MYDKDPSGFHEALGLSRSAALEQIWAPHRSHDSAPSGEESEQGSAGQLTNDPKFSEGQETGSERSFGEKIIDILKAGLAGLLYIMLYITLEVLFPT